MNIIYNKKETLKRNKVLIHTKTWMNLENSMLTQGRQ